MKSSFENRFGRFGFAKAMVCGFALLLGCTVDLFADPIFTPSVLISLAISAAFTAASIGLQLLFQPKPKPYDKNKLQGDIQITSTGEDIPIPEIYGQSLGDGYGGMRLGGIIFYASEIRKVEVITPGTSDGGKGAPKSPPNREFHYYVDLAILFAIWGPHRLCQLKANTDLLYQDFTSIGQVRGTTYQAEARTGDSANVTVVTNAMYSGGQAISLDNNEYIEWNNISSGPNQPREVYIVYRNNGVDQEIDITVNGGTAQRAVLPDSFDEIAAINMPQEFLDSPSNSLRITSRTAGSAVVIDRIVVGFGPLIDPNGGECFISGVRYPGYSNPQPTYDHLTLRDPLIPDPRGCDEYNYQPNLSPTNGLEAQIVGNGTLRWYPGNTTQLPDPMLQAYFESVYGAGSTPAFRNRAYVVLENFEITKYGSIPNFTAVWEHRTIGSVGEMFEARAKRAGLDETEFDFTDLHAVPLRGMAITQKQSPSKEMQLCSRVFDIDVYEDFDGVIRGVIPDETIAATIPTEDLAVQDGGDSGQGENAPSAPLIATYRDETDVPYFLDVSYFDPSKDFDTRNVHSLREAGGNSDKKDNIETGLVLTEEEAQRFADRELHKMHVERDGYSVDTFHKYAYLQPTQNIRVADSDGGTATMRIKSKEGWIPGKFTFSGVSREAIEYPPRVYVLASDTTVVPSADPPAPIVGTFIDLALFDEQANPGFYVAASPTDPHYRWQGAGVYRLGEDSEWQPLAGIQNRAIMGRTIAGAGGVLGAAPVGYTGAAGNFDTTNSVTIDLFVDEDLASVTDAQVENDGANTFVIGGEIIQAATITRVGGYYSRFTLSRLKRKISQTSDAGHASADRAVLRTAAWLYLEQDAALAGTSRTYKLVGAGGNLDTASSVDFDWTGRTRYVGGVYENIDSGVPSGLAAPTIYLENGFWVVNISRPTANGLSAYAAEIRVRKSSDDSLVRQWDIGNAVSGSIIAQSFNCKVDYRWRNRYNLSGSDGWSAFSPVLDVTAGSVGGAGTTITGGGGTDPGDFEPVCFLDGVEFLLADWSVKEIQDILPTDHAMAWGPTGRLMPAKIPFGVRREMVYEYRELELDDGDVIPVTETHPFEADWGSKVRVRDMDAGQRLRSWQKGWGFCSVTREPRVVHAPEGVWVNNVEIAVWHRYLVRAKGSKAGWKAVYNRKSGDY